MGKSREGRLLLSVSGALVLASCGGGSGPSAPSAVPTPAPTAAPTARYSVSFDATWSAQSHPDDFPARPHFSSLIGGTHSAAARFWAPGGVASDGIEAMAELGATSPLDREVEAAIAAGAAERVLRGPGIDVSPGSAALEFEIGREFPLVTLVSMVAPSPDWFVGVHDLSLIENGEWVREKVVSLQPYDAGTDDGVTYQSPNRDARPRGPIREIDSFPFAAQGRVAPLGTFTFRRLQ